VYVARTLTKTRIVNSVVVVLICVHGGKHLQCSASSAAQGQYTTPVLQSAFTDVFDSCKARLNSFFASY
jgi:hypothetical protein